MSNRPHLAANERKKRYRARLHAERYGEDAGDMRGRHGNHARGKTSARWNVGQLLSSHGYVLIRVGASHPLAFGEGYAYEHHLVWSAAGREQPRSNETLHHINGDKSDNRLENLEKMTRTDHGRHHIEQRARDTLGRVLGKSRLDGVEHGSWPGVPA